jgi:hypothetical protein
MTARKPGESVRPVVVAVDECQALLTAAPLGEEARAAMRDLLRRGRSVAVCPTFSHSRTGGA